MAERPRRGSFGPVVLLGLAGGTLAAVAGNKPWATLTAQGRAAVPGPSSAQLMAGSGVDVGKMPVTTALALVVLAAWGVVLVTRGRVRRAVAVLGLLAALGTLVAVVLGWSDTAASVRAAMVEAGQDTVGHTAWFWAAAVGAVLSVVAGAAAVRLTPSWPEMGSRYDAPADGSPRAAAPAVAPEDQTNLDLWKAMDEGRDPTA